MPGGTGAQGCRRSRPKFRADGAAEPKATAPRRWGQPPRQPARFQPAPTEEPTSTLGAERCRSSASQRRARARTRRPIDAPDSALQRSVARNISPKEMTPHGCAPRHSVPAGRRLGPSANALDARIRIPPVKRREEMERLCHSHGKGGSSHADGREARLMPTEGRLESCPRKRGSTHAHGRAARIMPTEERLDSCPRKGGSGHAQGTGTQARAKCPPEARRAATDCAAVREAPAGARSRA